MRGPYGSGIRETADRRTESRPEVASTSDYTQQAGRSELAENSMRAYLKEIGEVPLLAAEDEQVLARAIEASKAIAELESTLARAEGQQPTASQTWRARQLNTGDDSASSSLADRRLAPSTGCSQRSPTEARSLGKTYTSSGETSAACPQAI